MKITCNLPLAFGLLLLLSIASFQPVHAAWQVEEDKTEKPKSEDKEDDENVVSTETLKQDAPVVDDRFLRFEMWDGTVVSGIVSIGSIDVETEFGSLEIPISRLIDFRPGLISLPELKAKVDDLVAKLGDREFKTREAAHRDLVAMGPMLAGMISSMDDGGDAERKKHITKIKQEISSMMDDEDEESSNQPSLTSGDRVQTPEFAIVGKIVQKEFQVKSKIGDLRIMLGDVKRADRGIVVQTQALRKTVSVAGQTFFQKKPVNTKIRVSKGDRITISATGVVQWTNWNQTASPDGLPNQGNWNGISNGALAARIGSDGSIVSVGSDKSFKADRSGILYLAIAMNDNYVRNTGYRWTGKFKAKIKVAPAE